MKKRLILNVILILILIALMGITFLQQLPVEEGGLKLSIAIDKAEIITGEGLGITLTLTNKGDEEVKFMVGPPFFDIYLYDQEGKLLTKYTDGRAFATYVKEIALKPGESFSQTITWDLAIFKPETEEFIPLQPGEYNLAGIWLGDPSLESERVPVKIRTQP